MLQKTEKLQSVQENMQGTETHPEEDRKKEDRRSKWWIILMILLCLVILVTLSGAVFFSQLGGIAMPASENIIEIASGSPDYIAKDGKKVWKKNTKVDIFRAAYKNKTGEIIVSSKDGEKIIAPGTKSAYHFYLKNAGNVVVSYDLSLKSELTVEGKRESQKEFPVSFRLRDSEKYYPTDDQWIFARNLGKAISGATLSENTMKDYTLEWQWDLGKDTYWQNLSGKNIVFTLKIITSASGDTISGYEPSVGMGLWQNSGLGAYVRGARSYWIWPPLLILMLVLLVTANFLYLRYRRHKERHEEKEKADEEQQAEET